MDLTELETDLSLEEDGVWVDLGDKDGTQLLIARIGNPKFTRVLRQYLRPYRQLIQRDALAPEKQEAILTEVMSECILLGWKNLMYQGKKVNYSTKRALEMMTDIKDFRELVTEVANNMETFKAESEAEDAKNSKAS